jgi:hypothetical protein
LSLCALVAPNLQDIVIEEGNLSFKVRGNFIVDFEGLSMVRYFGQLCEVTIWRNIRKLSSGCFAECRTVSNVIFESDSQLSCIESYAFSDCIWL